jgi:formamidopyrimidine-DNA glycosylase
VPELPEVEILVRHLRPLLLNRTIRAVEVRRAKVAAPTPVGELKRNLTGATFTDLSRRGKYLLFSLKRPKIQPGQRSSVNPRDPPLDAEPSFQLLGHLGMTGRMYLTKSIDSVPKHAAVILDLGRERFVFEDARYFGRFTLDTEPVCRLGPEPLSQEFSAACFHLKLKRSKQAIKIRLLDQSLIAGVGNIYASEALHRAGISPRTPASELSLGKVRLLLASIRDVLSEAIRFGSTVPLSFAASEKNDRLFYYGRAPGAGDHYVERLRVYGRGGEACLKCGAKIRVLVLGGRSTFFCPRCQRMRSGKRA